jgi:hypothetical protein
MDIFAGFAIALYVGHHIGDYWVQSDHDAAHKGKPGRIGALSCLCHVATYVATQIVCTIFVVLATGTGINLFAATLAFLVSGLFHYAADRREFGIMFKLARMIPGKANFLKLGVPRQYEIFARPTGESDATGPIPLDNPSLGTGAWALDQSWHIATSVFLPALIIAGLS